MGGTGNFRGWQTRLLEINLLLALPLMVSIGNSHASTSLTPCKPLYPVFCANLHVACVGKSTIPTIAFFLRRTDAAVNGDTNQRVGIFSDDKQNFSFSEDFQPAMGEVVFHAIQGRDWIRIERDGRFSHRIYRKGKALMSVGWCKPERL